MSREFPLKIQICTIAKAKIPTRIFKTESKHNEPTASSNERTVCRLHYLLDKGHDDDKGGGDEGPASAHGGPDVEAMEVEDVDREHAARPDADKQEGEGDGGDVGGHLGGAELADDDLEGGAVVKVFAVLEVQLALAKRKRESVDDVAKRVCRLQHNYSIQF